MLHHVSFSVRDTQEAAARLSELVGGTVVRGPAPPFPPGSMFVTLADAEGSMIELLPWGSVQTSEGVSHDPDMRPFTASHVLIGSPLREEEALAIAESEGLAAQRVDTGLFRFVKVWIEDSLVVELLTRDHRQQYVDWFGLAGEATLDHKLRQLEQS